MTKVTLNLDLKKFNKSFKEQFKRDIPKLLKKEILRDISEGRSPVGKGRRFKRYSEVYREKIKKSKSSAFRNKRVSPVNMKLSGKMLRSLSVRPSGKSVLIKIVNKLADIHNRLGAGKIKEVRRLLPTRKGEQFNSNITDELLTAARKLARKLARRFSR